MQKISIDALAAQQLRAAAGADSGRAADTVFGGHEKILRQTVIAMVKGTRLSEHQNPGEATIFVLRGRVARLCGTGSRGYVRPGQGMAPVRAGNPPGALPVPLVGLADQSLSVRLPLDSCVRPMSPERAHVDGRDHRAPGRQSSFALTNSARTALVAGTVSIALSAAP